MDFLKRYWLQIQAQSQGMTASQKWLIATVLTLGLVISGLLILVAGTPQQTAISFSPDQANKVMRTLMLAGIEAEQDGGQVLIARDDAERAMVIISQSDLAADDISSAFDQLIADQSPWITDKQGEQRYNVARQQVVAKAVGSIKNVRRADVIIDIPKRQGFDQTHKEPSAAVTVTLQGGQALNKELVKSIAGIAAGSLAELKVENVVVVDAVAGKSWSVQSDEEPDPAGALEMARSNDRHYREKIEKQLRYIPGVIVEVNVETSDVRQAQRVHHQYQDTEPLRSEESEESTSRNLASGGEPGPRSNVGLDINGSSASGGSETSHNRRRSEFGEKPLVETLQEQINGYTPQQVNVSIGIPYSYFVGLNRLQNPPAEGEEQAMPSLAELQPLIDEQTALIRTQVEPLANAKEPPVITVAWVPDDSMLAGTNSQPAETGLTTLATTAADWAGPIGIVGLSGAALLMMFMMVRKATQPEQLPSVEELAGVPPDLPDEDELVGEVDEVQDAMSGVELNEDELNSRRIAQQISELIKANPDEAGHLINKWVQIDE